jgi:hypothetical protein
VPITQTEQKLADITDAGYFEKLATAVLREVNPAYAAVIHPGVNAAWKTVKGPVDGVVIRTDINPPRLYTIQHTTTTSQKNLASKWLGAENGDLAKVAKMYAEAREETPELTAELVLTSNQEPDGNTGVAVGNACVAAGMHHEIWGRTRLAHFLDFNPTGQYIRRKFLEITAERISKPLLQELSSKSLEVHAPKDDAALRVPRELDADLKTRGRLTFLIGRSGNGKSVACHKKLRQRVEEGGFGLVLTHEHIAKAATLADAISAALHGLHPELLPNAGLEALTLCSPAEPLHLTVEDINQSGQASVLAEKIYGWLKSEEKEAGFPVQLICPVWPDVWRAVDRRVQETAAANVMQADPFSPREGRAAVQRRAKAVGRRLSDMAADKISAELGHDPLLIAIYRDPSKPPVAGRVIEEFVDDNLQRVAKESGDYVAADYRMALRALATQMLLRRELNPRWSELRKWSGLSETDRKCIGHLVLDERVLYLGGASDRQSIAYRHDRIRDWILSDAVADTAESNNMSAEISQDPYYARVLGGAIALRPGDSVFVDSVRTDNPLSLFYAYRQLPENPKEGRGVVAAAITAWLERGASKDRDLRFLRREALRLLADTDGREVIALSDLLEKNNWAFWQARFRNGDLSGLMLFHVSSPATTDPIRDALVAHAKQRFGRNLITELEKLLERQDLDETSRQLTLRLAGHLADPALAAAIAVCWENDADREKLASDYLWAAAQCCGNDAQTFLKPILDLWETLPARDRLAHDEMCGAFGRQVPVNALAYLVTRASGDLRWPIALMLSYVDDPVSLRLIVEEMAFSLKAAESSKGIALFYDQAPSPWERPWDRPRTMSAMSRASLLVLWQAADADTHFRKAAFRLWAANELEGDLAILQASTPSSGLDEMIFRERLTRGDTAAIPFLREKILSSKQPWAWWWCAKYAWSDELIEFMDEELTRRPETLVGSDELAPLLLKMPPEAAQALFVKHWSVMRNDPVSVRAALLLGTPKLQQLVREAVEAHESPATLLEHFGMYACGGVQDYQSISREDQIAAFAPYFHLLNEHDVRRLWDTCNKLGFFEARKRFVDPIMRQKGRVPFVDEDATDIALDGMAKPDRLNWVDRWLEDYRKTGADSDKIFGQVSGWLSRRQTIEAFRLACEILVTIGERKHLAVLDVYSGTDEEAASLRENARYAVMRRSLI